MLFQRRHTPHWLERLRHAMWPRTGWRRAIGYSWHRVSRLRGTPHAIAIGFAAGVFASFTPFMGFHFLLGFAVAFALGGSLIASAVGTFVGNPVTFPFIWFASFKIGALLLGFDNQADIDVALAHNVWWSLLNEPGELWRSFLVKAWTLILPMTVGSVPLGVLAGSLCYFPVRYFIAAYQRRRRERFAERNRLAAGQPSNEVSI